MERLKAPPSRFLPGGNRTGLKVNLLCIAGAALGVVSLFLPLMHYGDLSSAPQDDYVYTILPDSFDYGWPFTFAVTLMLLGMGLAFLSPSAGFLLLSGVLGVLYLYPLGYRDMPGGQEVWLGAYLALASAAIVVFSFFRPSGVGYPRRLHFWHQPIKSACRYLTTCPYGPTVKLRVNMLCVGGALLAFVAISLPWLTETHFLTPQSPVEVSMYGYLIEGRVELFAWLFLIGSAAAFVTPLASLVQLVGFYWLYVDISSNTGVFHAASRTWSLETGLGVYVGAIALAMVAASFFLPVGAGYFGRNNNVLGRLVAWGQPAEKRGITAASLIPASATKSFK